MDLQNDRRDFFKLFFLGGYEDGLTLVSGTGAISQPSLHP